MKQKWLYPILLLGVMVYLAMGCAGLPEQDRSKAKALPETFAKLERNFHMADSSFTALKRKSEYTGFLATYDGREKWSAWLRQAQEDLGRCKGEFDLKIKPLLKNDDPKDAGALRKELEAMDQRVNSVVQLTARPLARAEALLKAKKDAPAMAAKARQQFDGVQLSFASLSAAVTTAQGNYPAKAGDLRQRLAPVQKLRSDAGESFDVVRRESGASSPDYAAIVDECAKVGSLSTQYATADQSLRQRVGQLDRSYAKILVDMKAVPKPMAEIVRYEWSEYSDWDNTSEAGKREEAITMAQYQDWSKRIGDGIRIAGGEGSGYEEDVEEVWLDSTYYHRYTVEENGSQRQSDWEQVDENFFDEHQDDLGMMLVYKPLGVYEDEVTKTATPPGMHLVGNSQAGQWKKDASGNSFWEFYGRYHFYNSLFGYRPYYQNDWRDWDSNYRGRRAYYGSDPKEDRYGSSSSAARTRFATSNYASQGGFKAADPSVRSAGPSRRGGGPGGAGK